MARRELFDRLIKAHSRAGPITAVVAMANISVVCIEISTRMAQKLSASSEAVNQSFD
jgi:Holliday junction resolvase